MSSSPVEYSIAPAGRDPYRDRRPPYSEDAEQAVIGAMLLDADAVMRAAEHVDDTMVNDEHVDAMVTKVAMVDVEHVDDAIVTVENVYHIIVIVEHLFYAIVANVIFWLFDDAMVSIVFDYNVVFVAHLFLPHFVAKLHFLLLFPSWVFSFSFGLFFLHRVLVCFLAFLFKPQISFFSYM